MTTILITLCILMMLILFFCVALVGALVGVLIRALRNEVPVIKRSEKDAPPEAESAPVDEEERRKIKEEKEQQEAQLRAFQQLLDYNPEIAYGLGRATADADDRG